MNNYAFVDSQGYVQQVAYSVEPFEIPGLTAVEIAEPIPESPNGWYQYHLATQQWVDTRTEQQKYDDAAAQVKKKRDFLLYESDWTQIPNNPLTNEQQQAWAVYRQELRDIPQQAGYPFNVDWPIAPAT